MSLISIFPPFPVFANADGSPLNAGYIYIGEANLEPQSNPVPVFWDELGTIPAAQPLRTTGGYVSRNGTPARIYTADAYSISVYDKNRRFVYNAPIIVGALDPTVILVQEPYTGSVPRTLQSKLTDITSVRDFGGVGDGVTDDTVFFGLAARNLPAVMGMSGPKAAATRPDSVRIVVPAGQWLITDYVDCNLRFPIWELDQGAKILGNGATFLPGTISRPGQRLHSYTCSTMDPATTFNVKGNNPFPESGAEVTGISIDQAVSLVTERASVALYIENRGYPPLFTIASPAYSATGMTFAAAIDKRRIIKGMIVDTAHLPNKYSGVISGVSADGKTITVTAWYLSNGVLNAASTPPNDGSTAYVNPANKIWAQNTNGFLFPESFSDEMAINETGTFNYRANFIPGAGSSFTGPRTWGFDSVNLGTFQSEAGYIQRGNFHYGFYGNAITSNFRASGVGSAFTSDSTAVVQMRLAPAFDTTYQVSNIGSVEAGSLTVASTPTYDFHSSGNSNDYDCRIIASGGSASTGTGLMSFSAGGFAFNNQIRPTSDGGSIVGTPTFRFQTYYGVDGAINTSDAREKTVPVALTAQELAAAKDLSKEISTYKWLNRIEAKGDDARLHIGMTVQRVIEIMTSHGLDPFEYGFVCYDKWEDEFLDHPAVYEKVPVYADAKPYTRDGMPIYDEAGQQVFQPPEVKEYADGDLITQAWTEHTVVAGDRFSMRYDELNLFIAAGLNARLLAIEESI